MMIKRPDCLPADRPWPPRRQTPALLQGTAQRPADGLSRASAAFVTGELLADAELASPPGGEGTHVLRFRLTTGSGCPLHGNLPVPGNPAAVLAARAKLKQLRRGMHARAYFDGQQPHASDGGGYIQLLQVAALMPMEVTVKGAGA